jgi:hypothetical protein
MSKTSMRRMAMRKLAARTIASRTQRVRWRVRRDEYDSGELCDMVSAALRVTETAGSCTIPMRLPAATIASRTPRVGRSEYDGE